MALGCAGSPPAGVVSDCDTKVALPPSVSTDILFVIDNSGSMAEEQAKVAEQLRNFVDLLASGPVENDFQVGVVTTGVTMYLQMGCGGGELALQEAEGEQGRLQLGKDETGVALGSSERKILASSDSDLVEQFELLVGQGVRGLGQEMGLEAMKRALSEPLISTALDSDPAGNDGFLRRGSRLLVVIVSDEDDCSTEDAEAVTLSPPCGTEACSDDSDCSGEGHYCLLEPGQDADGTVRVCQTNACETPEGRDALTPVADYVDFLKNLDDGTGRKRDVSLAVIGPVDSAGEPERCQAASAGEESIGVGKRYKEAVALMGDRGFIDSICSESYGAALEGIAELVAAPQVIELADNPHDGSLIQLVIRREGEEPLQCREGDDGFRFEAGSDEHPARLTMQGGCRLRNDDELELRYVCSG